MIAETLSQPPRDPAFTQDPYPFYDRMHRSGGVIWWSDYAHLVFARFTDVNAILRDRRFGRTPITPPSAPAHLSAFFAFEAQSMLELEGAAHHRLRRLVSRDFVSRRAEGMRPRIEALCHQLIDGIEPDGAADLLRSYCEPIPVIVIAELLGLTAADAPRLLRWSHDMVAMYQFGRDRAVEDRAEAATRAFSDFIADQIARRRAAPQDDLLTLLMTPDTDGGVLSEAEITATAILILNAGHEATVHALGNGVKTLLDHGARPDHDGAAAEEILRFAPPLHMFTRFVYEDMIFGGVPLKRGQVIGLSLGAAGRDPDRFDDPGRFDPTRSDPGHVSFGGGGHFCLGAPLARLEMAVALPILFDRLPRLRLTAVPRFADRYHFHGLERLEATWT